MSEQEYKLHEYVDKLRVALESIDGILTAKMEDLLPQEKLILSIVQDVLGETDE